MSTMRTKRKHISYVRPGYSVRVDVTVTVDKHELVADEHASLMTDLADRTMRSLNDTNYIKAPLSKIRVR